MGIYHNYAVSNSIDAVQMVTEKVQGKGRGRGRSQSP